MANSISLEPTIFEWDIQNFSLCLPCPSYLTSHTFVLSRSPSVWCMRLSAIRTEERQILISTHLCRNSDDQGAEEINVRFSLYLRSTIELITWDAENFAMAFRAADSHGGDFTFNLPETLIFKNGIDDTLTVTCEMISTDVDSRILVPDVNPDFETLSADLMGLFRILDIPQNATLVVGENVFSVHKEILSARSSVLARLLESGNNLIEIPHFSENVVKAILIFLYSGDLRYVFKEDFPLPVEIYRFAIHYGISHLQEVLEPQAIHTNTHINTSDYSCAWHIENFAAVCSNHSMPQCAEHAYEFIGMQFLLEHDTQHGNFIFTVDQRNLIGIISLSMEFSIMDDLDNKRIVRTMLLRPDIYHRCSCSVIIAEKYIFCKEVLISPFGPLRTCFQFKFLFHNDGTSDDRPTYSPVLDAWHSTFSPCSLPSQMRYLHESRSHGDAQVRVGDSDIAVHKYVLGARSSVFRDHFRNSERYDFANHPLAVVKQLVFYIYAGYLYDERPLLLIDLFDAATAFEIPRLKLTCIDSLRRSRLRPSNVSRICIFADREDLADLKDRCMEFICENADRVFRQSSWEELRRDHIVLPIEILHRYKNRKKAFDF